MLIIAVCASLGVIAQPSDIVRFLNAQDAIKTARLTVMLDVTDMPPGDRTASNEPYDVRLDEVSQLTEDIGPNVGDRGFPHMFITPDATYRLRTFGGVTTATVDRRSTGVVPIIRDIAFWPLEREYLREHRGQLRAVRVGDLTEVSLSRENGTVMMFMVSPKHGYNAVQVKSLDASGEIRTRADLEWKQYDGQWWWSHVTHYGANGLRARELSLAMAEFNRPTHDKVLTLASAGVKPGTPLQDVRLTADESGELSPYWDGKDLVPGNEYRRRINQGIIPDPRRQPNEPTQADLRRLAAMHADMYERFAVFFAREHFFTDAQLTAAEGIADDVRAHNPAATQPFQRKEVVLSSMMPRLQAMLTTKQAASSAPAASGPAGR